MSQKTLYCFDFDGTLTKEDTMFSFLKFYDKEKFYLQFMKNLPNFILLKLGFANAETTKKNFIASILKGEMEDKIREKSRLFFEENFPKIMRKKGLDFIQKIDRNNSECYLVTASLDIWVSPFAEKLGLKLISTQAQFENGIYTGHFLTPNCNGEEKVRRISQNIEGQNFMKTLAFGDTSGDKPMLSWADEGFFRFFH